MRTHILHISHYAFVFLGIIATTFLTTYILYKAQHSFSAPASHMTIDATAEARDFAQPRADVMKTFVPTGPVPYRGRVLGSATTYFTGSSDARSANIALGAHRITHTTLSPHEEYSLLNALGEVSEVSGFQKEYVIEGDRSVQGVGGGLCQLSTTLFRAALDAGLPITQRTGHSYVVGYYGPGLDATIYKPSPDFRFLNDTDTPITIVATTTNDALTVTLYGTPDGRIATTTNLHVYNRKPAPQTRYMPDTTLAPGEVKCTDSSREGLTTEVTYRVMYPDGTFRSTVFKTVYRAWPGLCFYGTKSKESAPRAPSLRYPSR